MTYIALLAYVEGTQNLSISLLLLLLLLSTCAVQYETAQLNSSSANFFGNDHFFLCSHFSNSKLLWCEADIPVDVSVDGYKALGCSVHCYSWYQLHDKDTEFP